MHLYHRNVHRYIFKHVTCYVNLAIFSDWEDVLLSLSSQSSSSSILHLTAISTTSRLGPSISLIRQRIAERTLEFWKQKSYIGSAQGIVLSSLYRLTK